MGDPRRRTTPTADSEMRLDATSERFGELLRRADQLLVEWARFGSEVRAQVEREARTVGTAVAGAVDSAMSEVASRGVDRVLAERLGSQLATLGEEVTRLESRLRGVARATAERERSWRWQWWVLAGGVAVANLLIVVGLVIQPRDDRSVVLPANAPSPASVSPLPASESPLPASEPAITPVPPTSPADAGLVTPAINDAGVADNPPSPTPINTPTKPRPAPPSLVRGGPKRTPKP